MALRRGRVGVGRVSGAPSFAKKAEEIQIQSLQAAVSTLQQLQHKLEEFAKTYQKELQQDPAFRHKFFQMCAPLGIDPFCSTKKGGFWSRLFNDTNGRDITDFYNELSVKVAEICIASRSINGGIISVSEISDILRIRKRRMRKNFNILKNSMSCEDDVVESNPYSQNEIITAVSKMTLLGSMKHVTVGNAVFIVSVPAELDQDHFEVLTMAQNTLVSQGRVTLDNLMKQTRWSKERAVRAMDLLLSEGMAWIDVHQGNECYWFPSIWKEAMTASE